MRIPPFLSLPKNDPGLKQGGSLFFIVFALFVFGQILGIHLLGFKDAETIPIPSGVAAMAIAWTGPALVIFGAALWSKENRISLGLSNLRIHPLFQGFGIWIIGLLLWFPLVMAYGYLLKATGHPMEAQRIYVYMAKGLETGNADWAVFFSVALLFPLFEELVFRGFLQGFFRKYLPRSLAVLATALLFALLHSPWTVLFPIFLLGLLFGYAREKTGSLAGAIGAHVLHNSLALISAPFFIQFYGLS